MTYGTLVMLSGAMLLVIVVVALLVSFGGEDD